MLGDQQRDKEMQRNQTIAVVLMMVLAFGWLYFFAPPMTAPPVPMEPQAIEGTPTSDPKPVDTVSAIEKQAEAMQASATAENPVDTEALAAAMASLVYDPDTAPAKEFTLANDHLQLVFTDIGARLKQSTVLVENGEPQSLVPDRGDVREDEFAYPVGVEFQKDYLGDLLNRTRWEMVPTDDDATVQFSITLGSPFFATVTKTFALSADHPNVITVDVAYTNTDTNPRRLGLDGSEPAYSFIWSPDVESGDENNNMAHQELVWRELEANTHLPTSKLALTENGDYAKVMGDPDWVAVKSAFFVVAMKAENYEDARGWAEGEPDNFRVALEVPRIEVAAGATDLREFKIYLGPAKSDSLAAAWPGLKSVLQFFTMFSFMDTFAKILLHVLNWFYATILSNYGFAIIFLTLVVRGAMFPLTLKGMKSMKRMQKLGPEIEKIKEELGDDQQEVQKRMMALYKERGVNPIGGCLPMLLQMPVFFAMYRVYATAFEFRGAPFVGWITDLSKPDSLFKLGFEIPLPFTNSVIDSFNLLPILMGIAMVASTKLMPTSGPSQNPQQKFIMTVMPVVFSVICYNMASGLNLYILTSTVLGIVQNYFVHVSDEEVGPKAGTSKKAKSGKSSKPRHFYAAAQARKREAAKEIRREKKKGRPKNAQD